jgi:hypothetical protein
VGSLGQTGPIASANEFNQRRMMVDRHGPTRRQKEAVEQSDTAYVMAQPVNDGGWPPQLVPNVSGCAIGLFVKKLDR